MMEAAEIDRLAARVRTAARDGGLIETAQVKLVGLDEVRRAAGERWPRMRAFVREGSLKIIASHVGPQDAVVSCGDGFLVVFADAANAQSEQCCAEIRDALIRFYLGEDALKALSADVEREAVTAAHLAGIVKEPPRAERAASGMEIGRFWPVWSSRQGGVSAFFCAPAFDVEDASPRMGYNRDFAQKATHRNADFLDLDLCLFEQAVRAAERIEGGIVGVSVHATTLQSRKARTIYLDHAAANASSARQRMYIGVAEVEPGTPLISLTEWISGLKPTFERVALELHPSDRALSAIASTGAWAAGYQVPSMRDASGAQMRAALGSIHSWCQTLRRQRIQPFMHGFIEPVFFDLANMSDIAFATGPGLWPAQASLKR
ncbi:hypothetical protein [Terricaulis silvestris]|uniref:Uncharacterized protein n=1 Tax=Terricaulis silvestris TaxID=2686094 RepID=A0A6I6MKC9_9CAUL|nr:hypothetical protein [Terricaulis silvestris]QGZ93414.1 hypothetical protein DSM104635_00224 [Terricaulis silvestris]